MNVPGDIARDTTAVVLAGGKGTRLGPLTRHHCKPALPFGAGYRNIDFSLSNCVNSDIRRIGIATQHRPETLLRHIDEVWSPLARRKGEFIQAWPSETRAPLTGYCGTADAVFRNLDLIERQRSELVLILAGDHVYQMDYRPMLALHRARKADVTVACIEVPAGEASQFGVLSLDSEDRIDRFVEKPQSPDELPRRDKVLASMGIYVFETGFLARVLRSDAASSTSRHDFGGDILPSLVRKSKLYAYRFMSDKGNRPGYWRDVGTPTAYWRAHLDLLVDMPSLSLSDPCWPLPNISGAPALTVRYASSSTESDRSRSLVACGCEVAGTVHRSVLFPDVRVAAGSRITRSVLLPGAVVGRNCRISDAIVESDCHVPDGTVIDASWRRSVGTSPGQPVVVTTDDFATELMYASA